MKKFFVSNIEYDMTDSMGTVDEGVSLPKKMVIYCTDEDEIADIISDNNDFCIKGFVIDKVESI